MYKIIKKEQLTASIFSMDIEAPHIVKNAKPGQFVILVIEEDGERIPLTIADTNEEALTVKLVVQAIGYSTKKMGMMEAGDYIPDLLGPLGEEAPISGYKKVLAIGGGLGIAPLYHQIKALKEEGVQVDSIIGGRTEELIIMKEEFQHSSDHVYYATDDGSLGDKGFVTDVAKKRLSEVEESKAQDYDLVIAIGPMIMMKAVSELTRPFGIKTNVSMNPIMIDGTGMCGGCRVSVGNETKFACVHGPDFDGHLVDFDEAIARQGIYKSEEKHQCRIGRG